ncbi:alpha/beta hydrolase [Pseudalkalibacillus sp. SCS-8]|uniref:alpha/beta fold hydrolase n=1 Tax=Pseudalkalibacillus nanhaiensis TaxID=3115291 RepID=UPI0032DB0B66
MKNYDERWIDNNGVRLHVGEMNRGNNSETPFVIIPGLSESVEDYIPIMEKLSPRHCVTITLRGRGQSDTPAKGYTLDDHISDIDAVIKELGLKRFILMGYSRGVSYTIGYAVKNPSLLDGLIIGDYPAIHTQLPDGWVDFFSKLPPWRGKSLSERMKPEALHGLQKESSLVTFWDDLSVITCPVLIIAGGKQGAVLREELIENYKTTLPHAEVVVFEDSDHNLFEPDLNTFIQTAQSFFQTCNASQVK